MTFYHTARSLLLSCKGIVRTNGSVEVMDRSDAQTVDAVDSRLEATAHVEGADDGLGDICQQLEICNSCIRWIIGDRGCPKYCGFLPCPASIRPHSTECRAGCRSP